MRIFFDVLFVRSSVRFFSFRFVRFSFFFCGSFPFFCLFPLSVLGCRSRFCSRFVSLPLFALYVFPLLFAFITNLPSLTYTPFFFSFFFYLRRTLLEAANRHRDGARRSSGDTGRGGSGQGGSSGGGGGETGSPARYNMERKLSFSSETATHHRYRHKDRRSALGGVNPNW